MREIEKVLKRFDVSLEWLMGRMELKEEEMEMIRRNVEMDEREKSQLLRAKRTKSIGDVLEEVAVVIDVHFYNGFSETKSSQFLQKVMDNQGVIDTSILKKTWRTLNCSPKTIKMIGEIQKLPSVGKTERAHHKEKGKDKVLVRQKSLPSTPTYCELLPKGTQ